MNTELFIARHIVTRSRENFSRPVILLAIAAIALGLAVVIIAISVVTGFQQEISDKVTGFGAHIQIGPYSGNVSYEKTPISKNQSFYPALDRMEEVRKIQVFALKAGIIKENDQIQGVVLKGVGPDYDWSFFSDKIIKGEPLNIKDSAETDDVLISRVLANLLKLEVGDPLRMYFIAGDQSKTRGRRFTIKGIYETGLEEFDKLYVIGDIKHIRDLNYWKPDQVGGFEVLLYDFDDLDEVTEKIFSNINYELDAQSIRDLYPQIFDWLELQDKNVIVILVLVVLVAAVTMISTLLILILGRTNMIGILKALGARNISIRKVFLYNAAYIIGIGLFWGNLFGIGLCLLQEYTGLITLDQESYYMDVVPINLNLWYILLVNADALLINLFILITPSYIIAKITPIKAIRFS
ncbi:MAG: ABC transporter permease [Bacteroidales bacterium]|nr:ABC transporter permease [Bacteroidales bacterium]